MLSFLQNQLGMSPPKRSESAQHLLSSSDITVNASSSNSEVPSLTPATSTTDVASISTDATPKAEGAGRGSERLRHARPSQGSYNVKELLGTKKRKPRRQATDDSPSKNPASEEVVVKDSDSAQEQLMHESEQALNQDWTLGALPGDDLEPPAQKAGPSVRRRRSTGLEMLEKASDMVENASSVLGKRGRETVDAGKDKLKALKGDKRSSLRPRELETQGPTPKKARFTEALDENEEAAPATKPERKVTKRQTKRWLSQGLYLGQDRDDDARPSQSKDKAKQDANKTSKDQRQPLLPLPMFGGQRLIDNGRDFKMPYTVFNPLPSGQPKPEEWKKTHKSRST